jgi:cohesin complex subunit SCC1
MEDNLVSGEQSLPFLQRSEPPTSAASEEAPEILDTHFAFGECIFLIFGSMHGT